MRIVLQRCYIERPEHDLHQRGRCQAACNQEPEAKSLRACHAVGDQGGVAVPQKGDRDRGLHSRDADASHDPFEFQKSVATYRIDLHLPTLKLAIEIDENNHADRDPSYEHARQERIEAELGCKFLRINPGASDFKLSSCIGRTMREIIHGSHDAK